MVETVVDLQSVAQFLLTDILQDLQLVLLGCPQQVPRQLVEVGCVAGVYVEQHLSHHVGRDVFDRHLNNTGTV